MVVQIGNTKVSNGFWANLSREEQDAFIAKERGLYVGAYVTIERWSNDVQGIKEAVTGRVIGIEDGKRRIASALGQQWEEALAANGWAIYRVTDDGQVRR